MLSVARTVIGRYGPEVLRTYALYQRGHPAGGHFPAGVRVFPVQISLAAQIPHALGLAWALQLKGEPGVACVFFGCCGFALWSRSR